MCVSIEGGRILFTFFQVRLLLEFSKFQVAWSTLQSDFILTVSYRNIFGLWAVPVLIIFHLLPTLIYSPPFSVLLFSLLFCFAWRGWPLCAASPACLSSWLPVRSSKWQALPGYWRARGERKFGVFLSYFLPTLVLWFWQWIFPSYPQLLLGPPNLHDSSYHITGLWLE